MKFTTLGNSRQPYLKVSEDVRFSSLEKKDLRTMLKLVILKSDVKLICPRDLLDTNKLVKSIWKIAHEKT
jgi:hypothetical protein